MVFGSKWEAPVKDMPNNKNINKEPLEFSIIQTAEEEIFYEGIRNVLRELPEKGDAVILTLKGHLIIEQLLIKMMEVTAANPTPLKKLNRLQFSTRLLLVRTLLVENERFKIWDLVEQLNSIRNEFAHRLTPRQIDKDIERFISTYTQVFGIRVKPPIPKNTHKFVTKDGYIVPRNVRTGTMLEKYRNALAGTIQGMAGMLSAMKMKTSKKET